MWDPYAEFESATLSNGLTVHAAHWPERPWEIVGFLFHSGAENDPVGLEGTAHFVEHLVSKNANASHDEMSDFFEDHGGGANLGRTGWYDTDYGFFIPADRAVLAKAFSMFGEMLLSAKLERFVELERQVIIGEFHRKYPFKVKFELEMREHRALYTGHWLERFVTPLGSPESVQRITQDGVQRFYDAHYTPTNMSIVGVGGMRFEEIIRLLSESPLAMSKNGVRTPLPTPITNPSSPSETRYVFNASEHIAAVKTGGYRSVAKIPRSLNEQVVRIMANMLGKTLMDEVREKRAWTYNIGASREDLRTFWAFSINCDSITPQAMDSVEAVIESCISSVGENEALFESIKRRAIVGNYMVDSTAYNVCTEALKDLGRKHKIVTLAEENEVIQRVTMDDLRGLLEWLRPERRWTAIMRP